MSVVKVCKLDPRMVLVQTEAVAFRKGLKATDLIPGVYFMLRKSLSAMTTQNNQH